MPGRLSLSSAWEALNQRLRQNGWPFGSARMKAMPRSQIRSVSWRFVPSGCGLKYGFRPIAS